jgi:integrase
LFLFVSPSGVRSWQFRYRHDGKETIATLGRCSDVQGLAWARKKADEARSLAAEGRHITTEQRVAKARRAVVSAGTFEAVAKAWIKRASHNSKWTLDYTDEVEASLRNHLHELNRLPLAQIDAAITAPLLERVERKAPDMARKVEQRLQAIMDYGVRRGLIRMNPLPRPERQKRKDRKHLPAVLDRTCVGKILRDAEQLQVLSNGVRRAHLLTVFTAQRIGELVPAEWADVDLPTGVLTIPRERMKRKDKERGPHIVPIPPKLLAMMREWRRTDGDDGVYICPSPRGDAFATREAVEKFYRRGLGLAGKHSPHSWRSVFSTWARDAGKNGDLVETQLDHSIGPKVQSAYDRAKRLELRRSLMGWYESQLISARDGADVVPIKEAR